MTLEVYRTRDRTEAALYRAFLATALLLIGLLLSSCTAVDRLPDLPSWMGHAPRKAKDDGSGLEWPLAELRFRYVISDSALAQSLTEAGFKSLGSGQWKHESSSSSVLFSWAPGDSVYYMTYAPNSERYFGETALSMLSQRAESVEPASEFGEFVFRTKAVQVARVGERLGRREYVDDVHIDIVTSRWISTRRVFRIWPSTARPPKPLSGT